MGDKVGLSVLHCYLGLLALAQGKLDAARKSFLEGLTIAHESSIKLYVVYNLIGMANVLAMEAKPSQALTLLSAVSAIAGSLGFKIEPELQEPYDRVIAEARGQLSESAYESAWKSGENMNLELAVRFVSENQ
jgi:hypothetical protein